MRENVRYGRLPKGKRGESRHSFLDDQKEATEEMARKNVKKPGAPYAQD